MGTNTGLLPIPKTAAVTSAYLKLRKIETNGTDLIVGAYQLTENWNASIATGIVPGCNTNVIDYISISSSVTDYTLDIGGAVTGAVQHRVSTGSWKGAGQAALKGAAQGAIDGAFSGAISGAIMGGMTSSACFVAGTAILTASGYVAIENIKEGDIVESENPETGEKGQRRVVQTFVRETYELVHIFVEDEEIVTTPEHPFWVVHAEWCSAIEIRAGDILKLADGSTVTVTSTWYEKLDTPVKVYNFEVEDFHTYYVGGQSVLVHNRCTGIDAETTTHGKIRIGERGLTQREYDLLRSSKNIKTQADGAKVFIRAINSNKNNVLVINDTGEIITFIKEVTKHELKNLARNYGWR